MDQSLWFRQSPGGRDQILGSTDSLNLLICVSMSLVGIRQRTIEVVPAANRLRIDIVALPLVF